MSFPTQGVVTSYAGAWTPDRERDRERDRESVISGFTDASIYASLQRPTNLLQHPQQFPYSPVQQHQQVLLQSPQQIQSPHYSSPVLPLPLGHPRTKNSLASLRGVNARQTGSRKQNR